MSETGGNLGKLESEHGIAPAFLQRAVFVAVLSFVFFMAMLVGFYLRQNIGYFLLSTAFLIVYILTMLGWIALKKNVLKIHENGIEYKNFAARWDEIETISARDKKGIEIGKTGGEKAVLSENLEGLEAAIAKIKFKSASLKT